VVHTRPCEPEKVIADYDAALAKVPGMAWSHYGRGVALTKLGREAEG